MESARRFVQHRCQSGGPKIGSQDYSNVCGRPADYMIDFNRPDQGKDSLFPVCERCVGKESMEHEFQDPDIIPIDEWIEDRDRGNEYTEDIQI